MPGVNESDVRESTVDPKEAVSTESINVFTSAGQQMEIEASNQKTAVTEVMMEKLSLTREHQSRLKASML